VASPWLQPASLQNFFIFQNRGNLRRSNLSKQKISISKNNHILLGGRCQEGKSDQAIILENLSCDKQENLILKNNDLRKIS